MKRQLYILSCVILGLVILSLFSVLVSMRFGSAQTFTPQIHEGAQLSWKWVREDEWGIEVFFFGVQTFLIGGLILLMDKSKALSKLNGQRKTEIESSAVFAQRELKRFTSAIDATDFETPNLPNLWRSIGEDDSNLGVLHRAVRERLRELDRVLGTQLRNMAVNSSQYEDIKAYEEFTKTILKGVESLGRNTTGFQGKVEPYRAKFNAFLDYDFDFGKKSPA